MQQYSNNPYALDCARFVHNFIDMIYADAELNERCCDFLSQCASPLCLGARPQSDSWKIFVIDSQQLYNYNGEPQPVLVVLHSMHNFFARPRRDKSPIKYAICDAKERDYFFRSFGIQFQDSDVAVQMRIFCDNRQYMHVWKTEVFDVCFLLRFKKIENQNRIYCIIMRAMHAQMYDALDFKGGNSCGCAQHDKFSWRKLYKKERLWNIS